MHAHVVPIMIFSLGIFIFSVYGLGTYSASKSGKLDKASFNILNARLLSIHTTANGLLAISGYKSQTASARVVDPVEKTSAGASLNQIATTGEVTILNLEINN
jgi:hypothetical protein